MRGPVEHELKCWPIYFSLLISGAKSFEVRRDDRGFEIGDTLRLREWDTIHGYSGREIQRKVTWIFYETGMGLLCEGVVVMQLGEVSE